MKQLRMIFACVATLCAVWLVSPASAVLLVDDFEHTTDVDPMPVMDPGGLTSGVFSGPEPIPGMPVHDFKLADFFDNTSGLINNGPVTAVDRGNPDTIPQAMAGPPPAQSGVIGGVRDMHTELVSGNTQEVNMIIDTRFDRRGFDVVPDANQSFSTQMFEPGVADFNSPAGLVPLWRLVYDEEGVGLGGGAGVNVKELGAPGVNNTNLAIYFDFINDATSDMQIVLDLFSPDGMDPFGASSTQTRIIGDAIDALNGPGGVLHFHFNNLIPDLGGGVDLTAVTRISLTFNPTGDNSAADFTISKIQFEVPEPATLSLIGLAGLGLLGRRRRVA